MEYNQMPVNNHLENEEMNDGMDDRGGRNTHMMHQLSTNILSLNSNVMQRDIILEMMEIYRTMSRLPLRSESIGNIVEVVLKSRLNATDTITGEEIPINSKKVRITDKYIKREANNIFDIIFNCNNTILDNGTVLNSLKNIEIYYNTTNYNIDCKISHRYINRLLIFKFEKCSYTTEEFLLYSQLLDKCRTLFQKFDNQRDIQRDTQSDFENILQIYFDIYSTIKHIKSKTKYFKVDLSHLYDIYLDYSENIHKLYENINKLKIWLTKLSQTNPIPIFTRDELECLMSYVDSGADSWMGTDIFQINQSKILQPPRLGNQEDILDNEHITINYTLEKIKNVSRPEDIDVDNYEIFSTNHSIVLV